MTGFYVAYRRFSEFTRKTLDAFFGIWRKQNQKVVKKLVIFAEKQFGIKRLNLYQLNEVLSYSFKQNSREVYNKNDISGSSFKIGKAKEFLEIEVKTFT